MTKQQFKKLQVGDLVKRSPQVTTDPTSVGVVTRIFNNASRTINIATILWNYKGDTYKSQYSDGNLSIEHLDLLSKAKKI